MTQEPTVRPGPRVTSGLVALKIDVATRDGLRRGVPRLLALLAEFGARASFFLAFGPDDPGDGFRAHVPWPRGRVAVDAPDLVRRVAGEGHEVGLHGWDHRLWRTAVHELDAAELREQLALACEAYERILGVPPEASAAPAWRTTAASLQAQDTLGLRYASDLRDVRDAPPHHPVLGGYVSSTLQIPCNRPRLLEVLPHAPERPRHWVDDLLGDDGVPRVLPLSAEVEGLAYLDFLRVVLVRLRMTGALTATLAELAEPLLAQPQPCFDGEPLPLHRAAVRMAARRAAAANVRAAQP